LPQLSHGLQHDSRLCAAELLAYMEHHLLPRDEDAVQAALQEADHKQQGYVDAELLELALSGGRSGGHTDRHTGRTCTMQHAACSKHECM
jgi:hypothetical protein